MRRVASFLSFVIAAVCISTAAIYLWNMSRDILALRNDLMRIDWYISNISGDIVDIERKLEDLAYKPPAEVVPLPRARPDKGRKGRPPVRHPTRERPLRLVPEECVGLCLWERDNR